MFELIILKRGKYHNESLNYEYSTFTNMLEDLTLWLSTGAIKESDIYNIRWVEK